MKRRDEELERNQAMTTIVAFMDSYNQTIPSHFPKASLELLEQFRQVSPALFKQSRKWSIEKHRKRFMDWLSSRQNA
ncbi:MAG: hypothetical protein HYW90_03310 [Candidatus Sungbacteria bacterium]|nr:hypothetical protein [Candidatus Sungbacteria bacterium]